MAAGADAVVFDLEDGVDAAQKERARGLIAGFLGTPATQALRLIRFNAAHTAEGERDVEFFAGIEGFDGVVVPKVESAAAVERVAQAFRQRAPSHPMPVLPLLETPLGVLRAPAIAAADASIPALLFGAEDLTARLGAARTIDGEELLFSRGQIVMAAAAVHADAIDAIFANVSDLASLRRDCERARGLGFRGKMAIHPAQVPVINEAFSPAAADLEAARRVIDAYEAARSAGEAVTRLGDDMIELPIVERARRLLTRAVKGGPR